MIKLKEWEDTILLPYLLDSDKAKTFAIRDINSCNMPMSFESKLKLTQAILDGEWEVEEPLYYVKNKNGILLLQKFQNEIIPVNHDFIRAISYANGTIAQSYQLTRQEIIDYDKRYLEFLEEVE
ncbi:DUF1642 domain-containing protein [Streptococcus parauberis]|uniref:DUF1642 domain-containing protein n=1 Tax=Streptococcus parauberis TaxID=1348 RepID=UPI0037AE9DB4